jgi:DNA-binding CsgD family transcriptional regulator
VLLAYSGRPDEAELLAREVLASPDRIRHEDSLRPALVQALFAAGRWRDVVSEVERARDVGQVSESTMGRLLAEAALARIWLGEIDGAEADAKEAIAIGEATGDAVTTCFALGHLSGIAGRKAMFAEGVALAQRALEVGEGLPEADRRHPHLSLGAALIDADRPEEAKAAFRAGQRLGERAGTVWDLPPYHAFLAMAMYQLGEWDDAIAECEAGLAISEETGVGIARAQIFALLAAIALHRGEEVKARSCIASAESVVEQAGPQWGMAAVTAVRAELEASEGKLDLACSRLREVWQQGAILSLQGPAMLRLALRSRDEGLISMIRRRLEEGQTPQDAGDPEPAALLCDGLLQNDAELLLQASGLYASCGKTPAEAAARTDAATALASAGRLREARQQFDIALAIYAQLGASRDLAQAAARMRDLGIRRGVRAPRRRATAGWDALTDTELAVARLAAQGRTNPEIGAQLFISRRTVQTHLSHVFVKLDISSRVELAVIASQHAA